MNAIYILVVFFNGILTLVFGLVAVLNVASHPVVAAVGVLGLALASICFWLAKECATNDSRASVDHERSALPG